MNILDELEKSLKAKDKKEWDENKRGGSHHPSSASANIEGKVVGACLRAQYYGWIRQPHSNPHDGTALIKFEMGNAVHDHMARMFTTIPGFALKEASRRTIMVEGMSYPISGETDAILGLPDGDTIVEIKSAFGNGMRDIEKNGARPENVMQLNCYLKMFGVNKGKLLYIARDSGYRREFDTVFSEEMWQENISRWKIVEEALIKKEPPKREFEIFLSPSGQYQETKTVKGVTTKSDWHCNPKYCVYSDFCLGVRGGENGA